MNITEKLIKLRKEKKVTQEQLAQDLKISISAIRNYENLKNPRIPKNDILLDFAQYYNVSIEYLLNNNIENKQTNNIDIGKELHLSDTAINKIKKISNENLSNELNTFLDNIYLEGLMRQIHYLTSIYTQKNNNLVFLSKLYDLEPYLIKVIKQKNDKVKQETQKLLEIFKNKMISFYDFIYSYTEHDINFISDSSYDLFQESLDNIIDYFNENDVNSLKAEMVEYIDLCNEILNKIIVYEDFNKYHIKEAFDNFLYRIAPINYDYGLIYYADLDKYYQYMNCDFSESVLKKIRNIIKENTDISTIDTVRLNEIIEESRRQNGSTRNNKK